MELHLPYVPCPQPRKHTSPHLSNFKQLTKNTLFFLSVKQIKRLFCCTFILQLTAVNFFLLSSDQLMMPTQPANTGLPTLARLPASQSVSPMSALLMVIQSFLPLAEGFQQHCSFLKEAYSGSSPPVPEVSLHS